MARTELETAAANLAEQLSQFEDWEERYGFILDLARELAPFPEAARTEANRVRGCASQVWLNFSPMPGQPDRLFFQGDSDAHLVRGLIAMLVQVLSGRLRAEIVNADAKAIFASLGLSEALTAQRSNGFRAMIRRVQAEASARA